MAHSMRLMIEGERYHIVKISAVDEYPNGTKLTNDIALHSDTASVSFKSMVSKFGGGENMDLFNQSNTGNMGGQMPEIKNAEQGSKVEIQGMRNAGRQIHKAFGYDLMSKAIATRIGNSWFRYDEEAKSIVDVSGMVMELDFPAMVMPERIENVNAGDVILYNDKLAFVVGREGNQLTIIGNDGEMKSFSGVRNTMMGDNVFIEKVNNMMNEFGFDAEDGLDPAVLMMAAGGMGQQGGGVNPFAIVAMASAFKK